MGILKRLSSLFTPPADRPNRRFMPLRAQCARCGETLTGEINLANDLSLEEGENTTTYLCRKVLSGTGQVNHCFQQVEVTLRFNQARKVIEQHVTGGTLLTDTGVATTPTPPPA